MSRFYFQKSVYFTAYNEGDSGGSSGGSGDGSSNNNTGSNESSAGGSAGGNDDSGIKDFSPEQQKIFNNALAKEKKRWVEQSQKQIAELKKLQDQHNLTEQQKQELQRQIDDLNNQFLSKEEVAKREREKLEKSYKEQLDISRKETEQWKNLFHENMVKRELLDAAAQSGAFSPSQIVMMLEKSSKLVEKKNEEGKPTGIYEIIVTFNDYDTDGKPVTLSLNALEAMKRMQEAPERWGNLFRSGVANGLGGSGSGNVNGNIDASKLNMPEYLKHRQQIKAKN